MNISFISACLDVEVGTILQLEACDFDFLVTFFALACINTDSTTSEN